MQQAKIRCGVIGVGYLGKFHAEKYTKLANADLVGVCDSDAARSKEIGDLYKVPSFTNYADLISKVDAVSIAATTTEHYKIAKLFLENKVHVLLEKPITATLPEAEELVKLAAQNKLILQIGHLERFNPVFVALENRLAGQTPQFIECSRLAPYKVRCTDVSVITDLMIHDIELAQHLTNGAPIKSITAHGTAILSPTADLAYARLEFANGVIANLTASRVNPKMERRISVYGAGMYFTGDLNEKVAHIVRAGTTDETLTLEKGDALFDEIVAFLDAITNKKPPVVTGLAGKDALKAALMIEKSLS